MQPYSLSPSDTRFSYVFTTDTGLGYGIVIKDITADYNYEDIGDTAIYEFQFYPFRPLTDSAAKDPRIAVTIIHAIGLILAKETNAVLYMCEGADGKEALRNRLFDTWFNRYKTENIKKIDGKIPSLDTNEFEYISVILNTNNKDAAKVERMFNLILNDIDRGKNPSFYI